MVAITECNLLARYSIEFVLIYHIGQHFMLFDVVQVQEWHKPMNDADATHDHDTTRQAII